MRWTYLMGAVLLMGTLFLVVNNNTSVAATSTSDKVALIAVSNLTYIDTNEVNKVNSLYDYLIDEGYDEDDIHLLGPSTVNENDGIANISNVENGFNELVDNNNTDKKILIYISDHGTADGNCYNLSFTDGVINSDEINDFIDNMSYDKLTFIVGGNQSGLAGSYLSRNGIDLISSMSSNEDYDPDEFNITRSLDDPLADADSDGVVTFLEAAEREIEVMRGYTQQTPRIWYG